MGAILTLFAALTVLGLFRARFGRTGLPRPPLGSLVAAAIYVLSAAYMLYFGFKDRMPLLIWICLIVLVALVAYAVTLTIRRSRAP